MSKQVRKKEVVVSSTETKVGRSRIGVEGNRATHARLIDTFSLRLDTSTTDPGAAPPEAPELELASATIAARRFARAD